MNNKEYLDVIESFQHCQRNWDLNKTIDDETIEFLLEAGYNVPTKQNLNSFKIVCVKSRNEIQKWARVARNSDETLEWTGVITHSEVAGGILQNPQTDANLLFLFFVNEEERTGTLRRLRESGDDPTPQTWRKDKNLEIGLAASAIGIAANMKGLKTGFCGCIWKDIIPKEWVEPWGVDVNDLSVMLGVGYPLHNDHTLFNDMNRRKIPYAKAPYEKIVI